MSAADAVRRVLLAEAEALQAVAGRLDSAFDAVVQLIMDCRGRVITCGVGKSGHIAAKAAATFASTGTPSFFLHAAEAVHGDLGMVREADVVLVYTYSGETDEVVRLFPSFKSIGAQTVAMTGRASSSTARLADLALDLSVAKEACPNNLAPTTSTTVMLAVSDALAVAVMEARGFGAADFARFHPAGALGRRLTLTVADVMRVGDELPLVPPSMPLMDCLQAIGRAGAGGVVVVEESGATYGYMSDGDLRRWLMEHGGRLDGTAGEACVRNVGTCEPGILAFEALEAFQNYPKKIGEMPVVDAGGRVVGLLMLKDLLRAGLV
ncbi:MAG: KpsF/GutQ family sugar-phosphate isomerase [Armatimonadetes bacterium]|nr:KpsF/GutQ family sugar-phosphate isomerase [Armatimonadota bacterium]